MIKVNEYFEGQVKSLTLQTAEGPASHGPRRVRVRDLDPRS
jgi:uncharacterized protein YaiE (UPF0345 family)